MFITHLKITDFRCLRQEGYRFTKKINIFYGLNGSGKTSILEAINFLSSGKSFRKGQYKSLINENSKSLTVFIRYKKAKKTTQENTLAVNKNISGQWQAQNNSQKIKQQSTLSNILPVVSIDPEIYQLIDLGPSKRRSYLDWLVFHVEHNYLLLWKKVNKCVKNLNNLYKNNPNSKEIPIWESVFIELSEKLNAIRQSYFKKLKPSILSFYKFMQHEEGELSLSYKKGWSDDFSLSKQLEHDREKNIRFGQLLHGPHKMNIKIMINTRNAADVLSRGQKKTLAMSFYMAYIQLLKDNNITPVVCLDDFDAELDKNKLKTAARFFKESGLQIFITTVHKKKIKKAFPKSTMFHVKHHKSNKSEKLQADTSSK